MNIEIGNTYNAGELKLECLSLRVRADIDLGDYVLLCSNYRAGTVTNGVRHALWFADMRILKGDIIFVFTRSGSYDLSTSKEGTRFHYIYWGLKEPIWNADNRAPVLLHAPIWETKPPDSLQAKPSKGP